MDNDRNDDIVEEVLQIRQESMEGDLAELDRLYEKNTLIIGIEPRIE